MQAHPPFPVNDHFGFGKGGERIERYLTQAPDAGEHEHERPGADRASSRGREKLSSAKALQLSDGEYSI